MQSPSTCRCPNPDRCSCSKPVNWTAYYNQHYAYNQVQPMALYQHQQPMHPGPSPPPFAPSQPPHHLNMGHPPFSGPPLYQYGPPNSIPFPSLPNSTSAPVDNAAVPSTTKRKRGATSSSAAPRKKTQRPRASVQSRSQADGAPVTTSTVVGAGPSTPVRIPSLMVTASTPLSSNSNPSMVSRPNPPSTSTNATYNAILDHLKASEPGERAIDIWWFIRPWETDETPAPLPGPEDLTTAIIKVKPRSPFLVCRMCLCLDNP